MDSLLLTGRVVLSRSSALPASMMPSPPFSAQRGRFCSPIAASCPSFRRRAAARGAAVTSEGASSSGNGMYTVGDFMTRKEKLRVVKPTTTVDEALEMLVLYRISGFPVIDDDWNLVGIVSDYDLLALDSISGNARTDMSLFPDVDSSWKTFHQIQKLLSKTNGQVIDDVMTAVPLVVRESSNLEDAARLLLETKYGRLPVVDDAGKLVGMITRGNVVRAALKIKRENSKKTQI